VWIGSAARLLSTSCQVANLGSELSGCDGLKRFVCNFGLARPRESNSDLGFWRHRFNENALLPLSKREPARAMAFPLRPPRNDEHKASDLNGFRRIHTSRSRSIGYGQSTVLSRGLNIKWVAEYCGTSVAMIEKHYGRYIKSDSREHLMRLFKTKTFTETHEKRDAGCRHKSRKNLVEGNGRGEWI